MPGDQLTIIGHHAGDGPAELGHAGGDLRHLVRAVNLGIAGVRTQPVERPSLYLARCKDQVHGMNSRAGGHADASHPQGQRCDQDPRCWENESTREGYPPGAILR
jgi:hypothetical protein